MSHHSDYAFPHDFTMEPSKGLTKREYMAVRIAAALLPHMPHNTPWEIAQRSITVADALLEELHK